MCVRGVRIGQTQYDGTDTYRRGMLYIYVCTSAAR